MPLIQLGNLDWCITLDRSTGRAFQHNQWVTNSGAKPFTVHQKMMMFVLACAALTHSFGFTDSANYARQKSTSDAAFKSGISLAMLQAQPLAADSMGTLMSQHLQVKSVSVK